MERLFIAAERTVEVRGTQTAHHGPPPLRLFSSSDASSRKRCCREPSTCADAGGQQSSSSTALAVPTSVPNDWISHCGVENPKSNETLIDASETLSLPRCLSAPCAREHHLQDSRPVKEGRQSPPGSSTSEWNLRLHSGVSQVRAAGGDGESQEQPRCFQTSSTLHSFIEYPAGQIESQHHGAVPRTSSTSVYIYCKVFPLCPVLKWTVPACLLLLSFRKVFPCIHFHKRFKR